VYDSTITATNVFWHGQPDPRIVVRNTAGVIFRDDFNNGYTTQTGPPCRAYERHYGTARGGARPRHQRDTTVSAAVTPFGLTLPTNGSYTVTLALSKFVQVNWNSPSVWLMAWNDFDHNIRFGATAAPAVRARRC